MKRNALYVAIAMTFFGLCWMLGGLTLGKRVGPLEVSLAALSAALLGSWAMTLLRYSVATESTPEESARRRRFALVNGLQGVVMVMVAGGLGALHQTEYIPIAVSVIVALHFIPLARFYRVPLFYITAASILVADAASVLPVPRPEVACEATGFVLWATTIVLLRGLTSASREGALK